MLPSRIMSQLPRLTIILLSPLIGSATWTFNADQIRNGQAHATLHITGTVVPTAHLELEMIPDEHGNMYAHYSYSVHHMLALEDDERTIINSNGVAIADPSPQKGKFYIPDSGVAVARLNGGATVVAGELHAVASYWDHLDSDDGHVRVYLAQLLPDER